MCLFCFWFVFRKQLSENTPVVHFKIFLELSLWLLLPGCEVSDKWDSFHIDFL